MVVIPLPSTSVVPKDAVVSEATDTAPRKVVTPTLLRSKANGPVTVPANVRLPSDVLVKEASALRVTGPS